MALTNLQYIRLQLQVPHRAVLREQLGIGDGSIKKFQTQLWPVIADSETIRADGTAKTQGTDYTIDNDTGVVTFTTAPVADKVVDGDYAWSVFSDLQINGLLDRYSDAVNPVLRDLIRALLSNTDLFIKYTIGMESVDRSAAKDALKTLLESLEGEGTHIAGQAVIWTRSDIQTYERDVRWEPFIDSTPRD